MSVGTEHRKLAAIIPLCETDIVGYSALARSDEARQRPVGILFV